MVSDIIWQACETLVFTCADLKPDERTLVISESATQELGSCISEVARKISSQVIHRLIGPLLMHGQEPPAYIASEMLSSDVIFGLTRMSMVHTNARYQASKAGARYLSLTDYSNKVMESRAFQIDYRALTLLADKVAALFTHGTKILLRTEQGTDLQCDISGRKGNSSPGWCRGAGSLASPPDCEANVAVLESRTNGVIVVDGSIPVSQLGLLKEPLTLYVRDGIICSIEGEQADVLNKIYDRSRNPNTRIIAEFGIGLNPKAELQGFMLEDEGCLGTIHLGAGNNITIGGTNSVPFHLDHVVKNATVFIDDKIILKDGHLSGEVLTWTA